MTGWVSIVALSLQVARVVLPALGAGVVLVIKHLKGETATAIDSTAIMGAAAGFTYLDYKVRSLFAGTPERLPKRIEEKTYAFGAGPLSANAVTDLEWTRPRCVRSQEAKATATGMLIAALVTRSIGSGSFSRPDTRGRALLCSGEEVEVKNEFSLSQPITEGKHVLLVEEDGVYWLHKSRIDPDRPAVAA